MSKKVLRPTLLAALSVCAGFASAGQLIDERTPVAPPVASASAGVGAGGAAGAGASGVVATVVADAPVAPRFVLQRNQRLSEQLKEWMEPLGWQLRWDLSTDWVIPADVTMDATDILDAVDQLARWLTRQGAPVQFVAFERNRIIEARSLQARTMD